MLPISASHLFFSFRLLCWRNSVCFSFNKYTSQGPKHLCKYKVFYSYDCSVWYQESK